MRGWLGEINWSDSSNQAPGSHKRIDHTSVAAS